MSFRVVPLHERIATKVRATMRAPRYGHPATRETATGYGPCRVCLQPFVEGVDERILFTHDPFLGREPFPLPGPVFIHAHECKPYDGEAFPAELRFMPVTLNAYAAGRELRAQVRLDDADAADGILDELLSRSDVDYVHVRNTAYGCFVAHVEPAAA